MYAHNDELSVEDALSELKVEADAAIESAG